MVALGVAAPCGAQLGMFSNEQRIELTREWKGDRFPDGRPKVPDSLLQELKDVDAEEAWGVLQSHGYKYQFEGGWHEINPGRTHGGPRLHRRLHAPAAGRERLINDRGKAEGRVGAQNSWPIDMLSPGDVSGGGPVREDQGRHVRG